ncbi:MAG: flagellar basal body P-ring protein FlgI [Gemmataceae bacterium]|nr:flagellar basal body P-ring protein FlgI [Gemmataceae bacterium]
MCRSMWLPVAALLSGVALAGCLGPQPRVPSAAQPERDPDLDAVRLIGDVTEVSNAGPIQVSGVGLVTGLEGTGGSARGEFLSMLEKELRQRKIDNTRRLIDNPNNALVLVTGLIPAGCSKHAPIDLEITLPDGSPCTSLRGGYLHPCVLRNYETTKGLDPEYRGGNRLLQGHRLAVGKGPLLVGFGDRDEATLKTARIWEGGVSLIERPFYLELKKDDRSARVAAAVATRINLKFPDDSKKHQFVHKHRHLFLLQDVTQNINDTFHDNPLTRGGDTAKAIDKSIVNVRVPYAYRYNPERYVRVARLIPLSDDAAQQSAYRARLHAMLQEPKNCVRAALRLEALGKDSVPVLRQGLSSPTPLVRFVSAEALTYLGSTAGVEELANSAVEMPLARAYALIALAGLNESVCRIKLQELMVHDDGELRAGAFQALRLTYADEAGNDNELDVAMRRLGGENLQAFWLHAIPLDGPPVVNFTVSRRAEIILFGNDIRLVAPARVRAGDEFIVTADAGDERCFISRISTKGEQRQASSLKLSEVLRKLVELGGQYPEAVDLLRSLDDQQALSCPVRLLSPPAAPALEELLAEARNGAAN